MKKETKIKSWFLSLTFAFVFGFHFSLAGSYSLPSGTGLPDSSSGIAGILSNLLIWLLSIFGGIAIISFIVSGVQYFLAAGDEKMMQSAKRNATFSIIGVVVALSAYVVIQAIDTLLRGSSTIF